jgi:Protein of unknown function (DUF1822)
MTFTFANSTEWWLEISPTIKAAAWEQSQLCGTPHRRWVAYLNQICLSIFLAWVQDEFAPEARSGLDTRDLPALWELVNGTAILLDDETRLILVPSESFDDAELEVPQEWVDIAEWSGNYYLAVQVKPDEQTDDDYLRIWGYASHQEVKRYSRYNADQRVYALDEQYLTRDMNALWASYEWCPEEPTKASIAPLHELPQIQAENLIQRLGRSSITFPRLEIPFTTWGALLEQQSWRRQLCNQRQGRVPPIQLQQWFQSVIGTGWESVETVLRSTERNFSPNFRAVSASSEFEITQVKRINWTLQPQDQAVLLLLGLKMEDDGRIGVLAQVHPSDSNDCVPPALTLSLLSETGDALQVVQARHQDSYIQLQPFRCTLDTHFSIQVVLDTESFIEDFSI